MSRTLERQAERFYTVFADLVRSYQFRDRDRICCHGVSISQCYALETLHQSGPASMGELARTLFLEPSTATRMVDQLVAKGLVDRVEDAADRRVCRVKISAAGREVASRIRKELIGEHRAVLGEVPEESREAVIEAVSRLLAAFQSRRGEAPSVGTRGTRS